jgi:hypothetical protein
MVASKCHEILSHLFSPYRSCSHQRGPMPFKCNDEVRRIEEQYGRRLLVSVIANEVSLLRLLSMRQQWEQVGEAHISAA